MKIGLRLFKLNNYISIVILLLLISLAISLNSFSSISTSMSAILPSGEKKELLQKFNEFKATKKIFIAIKGFDNTSLKSIKEIDKKLSKIEGLSLAKNNKNPMFKDYSSKYNIYKKKINYEKLANINIFNELEKIKIALMSENFHYDFDKNDPLNIFNKKKLVKNIFIKKNHLILQNYGYMSILNIDASINSIKEYERVYDSIYKNINKDAKVYSPIFYFVENSRIMKNDINKIILASTIILLLLYLIILRNIKLLVNTLITLASSITLSLIITSILFDEISIFVLVFGISISTISIDYMFHNYVHGYYQKEKTINKDVFFGMITTVGAFYILSFVSFDLIKQLCYFSIISLIFSYLQFTFLFPKIKFSTNSLDSKINYAPKIYVKPIYILIFSIVIISLSIVQLKFNSNIESLNIDNKKLKTMESFFNDNLSHQKNITVIIKAPSIEKLIEYSSELKKSFKNSFIPLSSLLSTKEFLTYKNTFEKTDFKKINKKVNIEATNLGFKKDLFAKAYLYNKDFPKYSKSYVQELGFEVLSFKDSFITYALVPKKMQTEVLKYKFIEQLSIKNMFEQSLDSIYKELLLLGSISFLYIIIMIFLASKQNYLIAFSYIIFPLAITLCISFFIEFNILHIFVLFIILSISIDYGIYMSSKHLDKNTNKAIFYSLLSTFAGFGVLIFSKINALYSIGIIATVGILSITILLLILKRPFNDTKSI